MSRLSGNGYLFTFITHSNARITSPLESDTNNGIPTTLPDHRGMSEEQMKRAAECFFYTQELNTDHAYTLIPEDPHHRVP